MSELLLADSYPNRQEEIELSWDLIARLKAAVVAADEPLSWWSSDGKVSYSAEPSYFAEDAQDEPVPYGWLKSLPLEVMTYNMNSWQLIRVTILPETEELQFEDFVIIPGKTLLATARGPLVDNGDDDPDVDPIYKELMANVKNPQRASLRDYANLQNALLDLENNGLS